MKKLLAIILVTIAVFSLSACGKTDNSGDGGNTEPKSKVVQPITDGGSFDGSNYS